MNQRRGACKEIAKEQPQLWGKPGEQVTEKNKGKREFKGRMWSKVSNSVTESHKIKTKLFFLVHQGGWWTLLYLWRWFSYRYFWKHTKSVLENSVLSLVRLQQHYMWCHISDVAIIARFVGFIESSSFKLNGKEMTNTSPLCKS